MGLGQEFLCLLEKAKNISQKYMNISEQQPAEEQSHFLEPSILKFAVSVYIYLCLYFPPTPTHSW